MPQFISKYIVPNTILAIVATLVVVPAVYATAVANCVANDNTSRKACTMAGVLGGPCTPTIHEDGTCSTIRYPRIGLDAAENYERVCRYTPRVLGPGGGPCVDGTEITFTASCVRAAGNACSRPSNGEEPGEPEEP